MRFSTRWSRGPQLLAVALAITSLCAGSTLSAQIIDRQVCIQPIQVRDDNGLNGAPLGPGGLFFQEELKKIWRQAGVEAIFFPLAFLNETDFLDTSSSGDPGTAGTFGDLTLNPGHGQNANPLVLNMWFVNTLDANPGLFGLGWLDDNGTAIAMVPVTTFNGGIGRLDTPGHEVGHNLGLDHNDFGAGGANNLMTSGGARTIPTTINDIAPDGLALDQLTAAQIARIRRSPFARPLDVPEPGTLAFFSCAGLVGVCLIRRRKTAV
jgi:hypothetical protein